jgi:hypothetical protein
VVDAIRLLLDDGEDGEEARKRLQEPASRWSQEDLERGRDLG